MYGTILVPIDGSSGADSAVARAFDLARTGDATVHVLHVVDTGLEPDRLDAAARRELRRHTEKRGREATVEIHQRATERGLEAVRAVREGIPHRVIRAYADEHDVDLIVMGTHGRTGADRARLGSTTERVIALADVPVLAVRLADEAVPDSGYGMYDHVVIPTDGSDAAGRAVDHGLGIAERYGADVHAIYVVDTTTYGLADAPRSVVGPLEEGGRNAVEAVATAARERSLPVTTAVLRGVPPDEILEYAEGVDADLLAMGTRGRTAADDRLLGSTTARVLRRSAAPVLTSR